MKKLILSTIILISMYQNNYSAPYIKFETGVGINVPDVYFVECIVGYKFKFWKGIESQTYGGWLTWASHDNYNVLRGKPFMEIYSLNQKFIYNKFFIHYKHYCAHPVTSGTDIYYTQNGTQKQIFKTTPYWWGGTMETISLGFEYEFK